MFNRDKIVNIAIKNDVSIEELFYLDMLFDRDWVNIYKYSNYTENPTVLRPNPNITYPNKEPIKIGDKIKLSNEVGLPPVVGVVGNRQIRAISVTMIADLIDRGFIERDIPNTKTFDLTDFVLTEKFAKEFFFDKELHIKELYDNYPNFTTINGNKIWLKVVDKESLADLYSKLINRDLELHSSIINKIRVNSENLNMSIANFVKAKLWESLEDDVEEIEERTHRII